MNSNINSSFLNDKRVFEQYFLSNSFISQENFKDSMATVQSMLLERFGSLDKSYSGESILTLQDRIKQMINSSSSKSVNKVIDEVGEVIVQHSININHPLCIAHLHCPPLLSSIIAEVIIGVMNQSMDSWDQSGTATLVEQELIQWFCKKYQLGNLADGIFTSGGTQSNFMGILLARDNAAKKLFNWSIAKQGLPPQAHRFRIICSKDAHFSVIQSARLLGLGEQSVVEIPIDENQHLTASAVEKYFNILTQQDLLPIAIVCTAGTTDLGSISPLQELGRCAKRLDIWFHIDAAFGGALLFSQTHRSKLIGIELADSLTIDFHKLFFQSISCGIFLLKNNAHFDLMKINVDYLNPESNAEVGLPDLVSKSIQTTRRFDALKIYMSLQVHGEVLLGEIIDYLIKLTANAAKLIASSPDFELATPPIINTLVFRYIPSNIPNNKKNGYWYNYNSINDQVRLELLKTGQAVIGFTKFHKQSYLKFTLMNPMTNLSDIKGLLSKIRELPLNE